MANLPPSTAQRADNLALLYQEVLTVIVRFRAGRLKQGPVDTFRSQIRKMIEDAEKEALRRGYAHQQARVATFAVVTFLDESILNLKNPAFEKWVGNPLATEMFQANVGGVVFFNNVQRLLGESDSESLADLLELHQLCMLLGFRGQFSAASGSAEVRMILQQVEEKIRRIRGAVPMPAWQPPPQTIAPAADRWVPVFKWVALACCVVALVLFIVFKVSLSSAVSDLAGVASQIFS